MLAGVASFSLMDAGLKLLSNDYPAMQVAALRGLAALPLVFAWAMYAGGPRQLVNVRWPLHLIRGVLSVVMMVTFVFGIQQLSLAKTYALFFVAPLLIAIFSVLHAGRARAAARSGWQSPSDFCGVLFVRPPEIVGWAAPLAILGTALCYALSSILVKIIGRTDTTQSMVFWMTCMLAVGATVLTLLGPQGWQAIHREHYLIIGGIAVTGAVGQWGITKAFQHAPAASVAPLEYSGMAWVILIDFFVWSVMPEWQTLVGAAVIIGSGLYLLRFESRRSS